MEHKPLTHAEPIVRLNQRLVYENRFAAVYDDDVRFADGRTGNYWRLIIAGGSPGVAVMPVCTGTVALVNVYRYAVTAWEWGIPRGYAHGDNPSRTAAAELTEELGSPPQSLKPIGTMTPDSAHLTTVVHLFLATYPAPLAAPRDVQEVAAVRWLPIPSLLAEIASGQIRDGFTLAAVGAAVCRGLLPCA